jgi:hypothetical protein
VAGWQELRLDLMRIQDENPRALQGYPDPSSPTREPPVSVALAAFAEDVAAELHGKYGAYVALRVGAFSYPSRGAERRWLPTLPTTPASVLGLIVTPVDPFQVRSGDSLTEQVVVANNSRATRELGTVGHLLAWVVDDHRQVVGGYVGAVNLPLVRFRIEPGSSSQVPVLLGAASLRSEIGYALPRGSWQIVVELHTNEVRTLSSPIPLAIT